MTTQSGRARGSVGTASGTYHDNRDYALNAEPVRMGGEIYVLVEFLSRVGEMEADWDRRGGRLDLRTR